MTFDPDIVPHLWLLAFVPVYLLLLAGAVRAAPWRRLRDPADANVLYGATVAIWIFWQVRASVDLWPGLEFHLLFMTSATLMFGWAFAFIVASVAQLGLVLQGESAILALPMAVTMNAGTAIGVSVLVHQMGRQRLPLHFFVYVFVSCVLGGALSMLASRLLGMGLLLVAGSYSAEALARGDFILMLPLMMFPEAFVNGALMTILVAYRPQWVASFRDQHYLHGK